MSHSVAGADLCKRRKRIVEQNVSHSHSSDIAKHFAGGELCKTEYFAYYGHPQFLSLEQGQFAVERKLAEIDFNLSTTQPDTPKDGDCMFHALMDQLEYNAELKGDVADVKELRWKIVHFGYTFYLKSGKISVSEGTPEDWKKKMSRSGEWGDEVALHLVSNVFNVDICIIQAFSPNLVIKSIETSRHSPLYIFYYSETEFSPAHYQSVRPRSLATPSLIPHSTPAIEDSATAIEDIQLSDIVISEEAFDSVHVLSNSNQGLNPVSILNGQKKKRGRPKGSLNVKTILARQASSQSTPEVDQGRGRGRGRGRG